MCTDDPAANIKWQQQSIFQLGLPGVVFLIPYVLQAQSEAPECEVTDHHRSLLSPYNRLAPSTQRRDAEVCGELQMQLRQDPIRPPDPKVTVGIGTSETIGALFRRFSLEKPSPA